MSLPILRTKKLATMNTMPLMIAHSATSHRMLRIPAAGLAIKAMPKRPARMPQARNQPHPDPGVCRSRNPAAMPAIAARIAQIPMMNISTLPMVSGQASTAMPNAIARAPEKKDQPDGCPALRSEKPLKMFMMPSTNRYAANSATKTSRVACGQANIAMPSSTSRMPRTRNTHQYFAARVPMPRTDVVMTMSPRAVLPSRRLSGALYPVSTGCPLARQLSVRCARYQSGRRTRPTGK